MNKLKLYDYYDHEDHHVTHFPFHYMDGLTGDLTATYFYNHFKDWFEQFPAEDYVSVWVVCSLIYSYDNVKILSIQGQREGGQGDIFVPSLRIL